MAHKRHIRLVLNTEKLLVVWVYSNFFNHTYVDASRSIARKTFCWIAMDYPSTTMIRLARELLQQEEFGEYMVSNIALVNLADQPKLLGFFTKVNNLFNESFKTGGFEQSRNAVKQLGFLRQTTIRTSSHYGRGTNYFLNVYVRF